MRSLQTFRSLSAGLLLIPAVSLLTGCTQAPTPAVASQGAISTKITTYIPQVVNATSISGAAWDPEAFWFSIASCDSSCTFPPITIPGEVFFERSTLAGAQASIIDPETGSAVSSAPALSTAMGEWELLHVPTRGDAPFFLFTTPGAKGATLKPGGPATLPAVPTGSYFPTLTLVPVYTDYTQCQGELSDLASDVGILDAVARFLTKEGKPTTPADFIKTSKYGGFVIWWLYADAQTPVVRVPADTSLTTSSAGRTLILDWAPPGAADPELQSPRGFFVTAATTSPIGLTVTFFPPGFTDAVQFTSIDKGSGPLRPFAFPPVPPFPVTPGVISFAENPALMHGAPPPPLEACVQSQIATVVH